MVGVGGCGHERRTRLVQQSQCGRDLCAVEVGVEGGSGGCYWRHRGEMLGRSEMRYAACNR